MSQASTNPQDIPAHVSARKKNKRGPGGEDMQLNMTSMIDVVFQLLVYFVVTASFAVGEGVITAKMPELGSSSQQTESKPPETPLNIEIFDAGAAGYRINIAEAPGHLSGPTTFDQLQSNLVQLQYNEAEGRLNGIHKYDAPVIIKPARRVRWQHVVNAFNATVAAKYENVAFGSPADQ